MSIGKKAVMVKYTKRKQAGGDTLQYFADELEKLAIRGTTVWAARNARIARELRVPGQVQDLAAKIVDKAHPIYHSWPLRTIPVGKAKRASYASFGDELEKIADGFMTNIGTGLRRGPANTAGAIGDIASSPIGSLRQGWRKTWTGGTGNKAMILGGAALGLPMALSKNDPTGRDESRLTRAMRFGVSQLGAIAGFTRGHQVPSMVLGLAGDVAGGYAGRAIDRARGRKAKPKVDTSSAVPTKPALAQQVLQG